MLYKHDIPESASVCTAVFTVQGMACSGCSSSIEAALIRNQHIISADVAPQKEQCTVEYIEGTLQPNTIAQLIQQCGYLAQTTTNNKQ